jgi:hypothetical protein
MAGALDDLMASAVRGWGTAALASVEAINAMMIAMLELADVESGPPGFNEEEVVVPAQPGATALHPGPFSDWDHNQLPDGALTLVPGQVNAGEVTRVLLRVEPPAGKPSGTYTGSLHDPVGNCLCEDAGVYVVGDTSP